MAYTAKKLLASTALALTLSTPAAADELRIDRLFVIGDSLSDNGAYTQAVQAIPGAQALGRNQAALAADPNAMTETVPNRVQLPPTLDRLRTTNNAADGSAKVYAEVLADKLGITLDTNVINEVPAATRGALAGFSGDATYNNLTGEAVGGTNYAQSGSRIAGVSDSQNLAVGITALPAVDQIDRLINSNPGFTESDVVIVWAGSNDVLALTSEVGTAAVAAATTANGGNAPSVAQIGAQVPALVPGAVAAGAAAGTTLVGKIEELKAAGASKIVVVTVPDIGRLTPRGQIPEAQGGNASLSGVFSAIGNGINASIATGIQGQDVAVVNADRLLEDVVARPDRYGFSTIDAATRAYDLNTPEAYECIGATASTADDTSVGCIQGFTTRGATADGKPRIYADSIHPTVEAHALFGDAAHSGLVAATQVGAIPVATLTAIRQGTIGLENRLNLGAIYTADEEGNRIARPAGNFEVYGGVEVSSFSGDPQQVLPGVDGAAQILKVAADVAIAPKIVVGAGVSLDHGQVDFDGDRGGFDSQAFLGAIFGVAEVYRGVYVNGVVAYGHLNFDDIDRNFDVGASRERYTGETDGKYFSAKIGLGAMVPVGNGFVINPHIGITRESVTVDGFTETAVNDGVLQRSYGDTEIEATRGTVAMSVFYRPPAAPTWTFGLRGSYEYDFVSDDLSVASAESGGDLASFSAPRPDRDFSYLSGSITKDFTERSSLTFGASTVLGLDGVDGYSGSLIYKLKF